MHASLERTTGSGRCHMDLAPNRAVWDSSAHNSVSRYDGAMFSSPEFSRHPPHFYPAIDPLSEKNQELQTDFIAEVLARYRIDPSGDPYANLAIRTLKDPVAVIRRTAS